MNNINPVKIELPQEVVTLAIQANHLQKTRGGETKLREVERLEFLVGEYVCGIIDKEVKKYLLK